MTCPLLTSSALTDALDGVDVEPKCLIASRGDQLSHFSVDVADVGEQHNLSHLPIHPARCARKKRDGPIQKQRVVGYPLLTSPLPTIIIHLADVLTVQTLELQRFWCTSLLQSFSDWSVHESNCSADLIAWGGAVRQIGSMFS